MASDFIRVRGARQHNLQNVDVDFPREKLVVLTGVSGSGKSSLAFDTLYAEGQRRYVQSLSAYARQFLDQMEKPNVDFIEGLSPAVAIEQRHSSPNPRSTIATVTEIYDYMRVLYAVAGQPHDPATGEALVKSTPLEIGERILALPEGTKVIVLAPLIRDGKGDLRALFDKLKRQGFVRVRLDGEIRELDDHLKAPRDSAHTLEAVVDRLVLREGVRPRLMEAIEGALKWNANEVEFLTTTGDSAEVLHTFTTAYANPRTGFVMEKLTPQHFSFNTHTGACPTCEGVGSLMVGDPDLLVPDKDKTLAEGAVKTWWARQPKMKAIHEATVQALAKHFSVPLDKPYKILNPAFKEALFHGTGTTPVATGWKTTGSKRSLEKPFEGLLAQLLRAWDKAESIALKSAITRFMNPKPCPACKGRRLRPESLAVLLKSKCLVPSAECEVSEVSGTKHSALGTKHSSLNIFQLTQLSITNAVHWVENIVLTEHQLTYCQDLQNEILKRLRFLDEVGLGYLALNRESGSLSGGEAQRIRLATQIGAGLAGVLYVLDEPSIGLHPADNEKLIGTLKRLRDLGNTVLVVEHDDAMMLAADHMVELGPRAGPHGGRITAQGTPAELMAMEGCLTGDYLSGRLSIPVPKHRVTPRAGQLALGAGHPEEPSWITVINATAHNLRGVTAAFPLGLFTCVTGASGSGKSTLIDDILRRALARHFYNAKDEPGAHDRITGLHGIDKVVVIDQEPIGRSPRSNPATYTGAFTPIRELYAQLPSARVRGYDAGRFSFNTAGGRCEKCEGDGLIKIDMHFLADVYVTCEQCKGQRYNAETLEIAFKGKNIAEVLDMTVAEASRFFDKSPHIAPKLRALDDCGLGYLKLGQSGASLSGGEAQRVKLAAELGKKATGRTLYLLDEPTTGLHFADIAQLMLVLVRLRDAGNTLIVIEHNLDVIKCADWIIDMGPGGGENGGRIVAEGPPEKVAREKSSATGRYLKESLGDRV